MAGNIGIKYPRDLTQMCVNARPGDIVPGSSSFITNSVGTAVHHLQYLPFGETFVDQQNGYDSRYTFSAKEKDDETQYSYFGARYYDSDLSVWLSVDPLSDKYRSISPYMYCVGNPVMLRDPNGMEVITSVEKYKTMKNGSERKLRAISLRKADRIVITHTVKSMKMYDATKKEGAEDLDNAAKSIQNEIINYWNSSNNPAADNDGYVYNNRKQKIKVNTVFEKDIEVVNSLSQIEKKDHLIVVTSSDWMATFYGVNTEMTTIAKNSNILLTTHYSIQPGSFIGSFAHEWGHNGGLDDIRSYRNGIEHQRLMYNGSGKFWPPCDDPMPYPSYSEYRNLTFKMTSPYSIPKSLLLWKK